MAAGIAYDFLAQGLAQEILLVDVDAGRLEALRDRLRSRFPQARLGVAAGDLEDLGSIARLCEGFDALAAVASYRLNHGLTQLAIERRLQMIDLGGNPGVVARQRSLDAAARRAGVTIIPDCGLAPGLVSILAADGMQRVSGAERVRLRVGGLPVHPKPPLDYALTFSAEGLINEYLEDAVILRNGRLEVAPALSGLETLCFPAPFGELEAFHTAGGASTLPETFADRLRDLDYKTIRFPGHCERIRTLIELGLTSSEPVATRTGPAVPREVLTVLLERNLPCDQEDVCLVRCTTEGPPEGPAPRRVAHELVAYGDATAGLSAMQRCTAFSAAIVLQMILRGEIDAAGVVPQEAVVPPARFLEEMHRRGLAVSVTAS